MALPFKLNFLGAAQRAALTYGIGGWGVGKGVRAFALSPLPHIYLSYLLSLGGLGLGGQPGGPGFGPHRAGAQFQGAFHHLLGDGCESGSLRGGQVEHFHPLGFQAHLGEVLFQLGHPLPGPDVAHEVMAFALQAAGHEDRVGAGLKGLEQVDDVHPAGAGHHDDLDVRGVLQTHRTCQVRGAVCSEAAAKSDDLGSKFASHYSSPFLNQRPGPFPGR